MAALAVNVATQARVSITSTVTAEGGTDRWVIAAAGVMMQLALGAMHAWSVYRSPLIEQFGWTISEVTLTYAITNITFGCAAFLGGLWLGKLGPQKLGIIAGTLFGLGVSLASFCGERLWVLYLTYGLLAGAGIGLGYIVPIATLLKWFPDKRGLIMGVIIAGFGAGPLITAPLATYLIQSMGVLPTFASLGIAYFVIVSGASLLMKDPPEGFRPAGWRPSSDGLRDDSKTDCSLRAALKVWQLYALWILLFLNNSASKSLMSQAAPMAQELTGVGAGAAAGMLGILSVGNGAGRFLWSWLSDATGRRWAFAAIFLLQAAAFFFLPQSSFVLFTIFASVVLLCFGGGMGAAPAFVADCFGPRHMGPIYGLMMTASGLAGLVGPLLIASMRDATGTYRDALHLIAAVMLASAAIPMMIRPAQSSVPNKPLPARPLAIDTAR